VIRFDETAGASRIAGFARHLLAALTPAASQDDLGSLRGKQECCGFADAASASGDNGGAADEFSV
jgi:hypothetical protein